MKNIEDTTSNRSVLYHPQNNTRTDIVNKGLKQYLIQYIQNKHCRISGFFGRNVSQQCITSNYEDVGIKSIMLMQALMPKSWVKLIAKNEVNLGTNTNEGKP